MRTGDNAGKAVQTVGNPDVSRAVERAQFRYPAYRCREINSGPCQAKSNTGTCLATTFNFGQQMVQQESNERPQLIVENRLGHVL